jgi:hypothetical protein
VQQLRSATFRSIFLAAAENPQITAVLAKAGSVWMCEWITRGLLRVVGFKISLEIECFGHSEALIIGVNPRAECSARGFEPSRF